MNVMDFFLWKLILSVQKILYLTWISFLNIYNFYLSYCFFSPREFSRIDKPSKFFNKILMNPEISTKRYLSLVDFLFRVYQNHTTGPREVHERGPDQNICVEIQ